MAFPRSCYGKKFVLRVGGLYLLKSKLIVRKYFSARKKVVVIFAGIVAFIPSKNTKPTF